MAGRISSGRRWAGGWSSSAIRFSAAPASQRLGWPNVPTLDRVGADQNGPGGSEPARGRPPSPSPRGAPPGPAVARQPGPPPRRPPRRVRLPQPLAVVPFLQDQAEAVEQVLRVGVVLPVDEIDRLGIGPEVVLLPEEVG